MHRDGSLVSRIDRRVRVRDIDFNLHMNQAVYATVTEYGRTDWLIRSGAWSRWRKAGIKPVVAHQTLVYRRELRHGIRYTIDTRAVAVEGRLLCLQGMLLVGDRVHARNDTKLIFIGPDGVLPAAQVPAVCEGFLAPALPVDNWRVTGSPSISVSKV